MTVYNAKTYGAVGNGSSHPASTVYGSLGALQAYYGTTVGGVTIALTNELDWLGTQRAIDVAFAAGEGVAYTPGVGPYIFSNANSVADGSGTLILPVTSTSAQYPGTSVDLVGDTMQGTVLAWTTDLGTGRAAISCGSPAATHGGGTGRYAANNFYEGWLRNLHVSGPGSGAGITPGTKPANMDGIMIGARRHSQNVAVNGFNKGWNVCGDYIEFETCYGFNNYYGFYYADANATLFGEYNFRRCMFNSNAMAGLAVSKNGQILANVFLSCFMGGNPYGILLEAGAPDSYGQPNPSSAIVASRFERCNWEATSNQFILDDNATVGGGGNTGTRTRAIMDTVFDTCNMEIQGTAYTTGGRGKYAYVDVNALYGVKFSVTGGSFQCPGSPMRAAFIVDSMGITGAGGVVFEGEMDTILATYATAVLPFLVAPDPSFDNIGIFGNGGHRTMQIIKPGEWRGNPEYLADTIAVPINAVMERVNYNSIQLGGTASAGTAPIAGINRMAWPSSSNGKLTIVATNAARITVKVTAAQTNGALVKMGAAGAAVAATSVTDGQTVGWVQNNNGASTTSVLITTVFPNF